MEFSLVRCSVSTSLHMLNFVKKSVLYMLLAVLLSGCAEEKQLLVVPVAGLSPDYMAQKSEVLELLAADFPNLKPNALAAIDSIPRMLFITSEARHRSYLVKRIKNPDGSETRYYDDKALPIGNGQSLLKLSDMAFLLSELDIQPTDNIYEVGVGSGYFTAILSRLGAHVYGTEINERLSELSIQNLQRNKIIIDNKGTASESNDGELKEQKEFVRICCGNGLPASLPEIPSEMKKMYQKMACRNDGRNGMVAYAPYDVIIITATISLESPKLETQLSDDETVNTEENTAPEFLTIEKRLEVILSLLNPGGRLAVPVFDENGDSFWHIYHWNDGVLNETASRQTGIKAALISETSI